MFKSILVVCVGNICRSPVGEALLTQALPHIQISSAGLSAEKSGLNQHIADKFAQQVAIDRGLDIRSHRARQLTAEIASKSDLILVMEPEHIDTLAKIAPESVHKALLFGQWGIGAIPDPYQKDKEAFIITHQKLVDAAKSWINRLESMQ